MPISNNISVGSFFRTSTPSIKAAQSNANQNATDVPLNSDEMALAQAHKLNLAVGDAFQRKMEAMQGECADKISEAKQDYREARTLWRESGNLLRESNYFFHKSGIEMICTDLNAWSKRLNNSFGHEPFNLPHQRFSFNSTLNAITIGIGSKVPMGNYSLWVFDFLVGAVKNGTHPPTDLGDVPFFANVDSPYSLALNRLLAATSSGNSSLANDPEMNRLALSLLHQLGIDTSRDFIINDTVFEIRNGFIQTKGFAPAQRQAPIGIDGLNRLVERAYAQNFLMKYLT
ncbi:MAG: hypothetical protein FWE29_00275 [Defluviitaleaceae bacterium]|nr:hypothetical protein [Defluviitaleaceae bacterium]